jgi:hypothetical protein
MAALFPVKSLTQEALTGRLPKVPGEEHQNNKKNKSAKPLQ